jgi:hypothetical protein
MRSAGPRRAIAGPMTGVPAGLVEGILDRCVRGVGGRRRDEDASHPDTEAAQDDEGSAWAISRNPAARIARTAVMG